LARVSREPPKGWWRSGERRYGPRRRRPRKQVAMGGGGNNSRWGVETIYISEEGRREKRNCDEKGEGAPALENKSGMICDRGRIQRGLIPCHAGIGLRNPIKLKGRAILARVQARSRKSNVGVGGTFSTGVREGIGNVRGGKKRTSGAFESGSECSAVIHSEGWCGWGKKRMMGGADHLPCPWGGTREKKKHTPTIDRTKPIFARLFQKKSADI